MNTKQDQKKPEKKCQCEGEINNLKKQAEEYKNKYLRALADYQNFEKRIIAGKEEIGQNANIILITKLLSFLDGLDKAELFIKDKNLKIIKDNFYKLLSLEGLEEIDVLGHDYDPYTAEVIDLVEGKKDSVVVEVLRKGYKLNGKMLRVAQVKVSKIKS